MPRWESGKGPLGPLGLALEADARSPGGPRSAPLALVGNLNLASAAAAGTRLARDGKGQSVCFTLLHSVCRLATLA